ncbi:CBL-interacting protein kinase 8 [Zea mays]|uniref:CBL-interacting protein kinase 8 n=1 Tax=Zea mays TaxID=4577 RepID=A0A3L6D7A9_MAIZE|nr:CBL-interacting protein kinase 8 [Zea mays]
MASAPAMRKALASTRVRRRPRWSATQPAARMDASMNTFMDPANTSTSPSVSPTSSRMNSSVPLISIRTVSTGSNLSIGIVRPYNAQVRAIQEKVGKTCRDGNICREPYRGDLEGFRPQERMNLFLHVKSEHQQFVAMYSCTMHYEKIFHGRLVEADARRYFQQLIDGVDFCHKKRSLPLRLKGILITEGKTEFRKLLLFFVGISKWQPRKLEGNMELLSY